ETRIGTATERLKTETAAYETHQAEAQRLVSDLASSLRGAFSQQLDEARARLTYEVTAITDAEGRASSAIDQLTEHLKGEVSRQINEARELMETQSAALATGLTSGTDEARRLVRALESAVVQLQSAAERTREVVDDTVVKLEERLKGLPERANQTASQVRTLV